MRRTTLRLWLAIALLGAAATALQAQENTDPHPLAGLALRNIGPALTSGRVADFAFHPQRRELFYVAMASAGVWKTENNGTTWTQVFRNEGAYATGVVALDPRRPETVWVGTGENNAQRSVGYGDGVYRSLDGGKTWRRMGLEDSGHISMIRFHPDQPDTVFVAAQGPLWNSGGDRGLFRSRDGGETWERILEIDADTGVNEFLVHPADGDALLASSYQRRRHVWTLINGGPGSGIHKSTDGGKTWRRLTQGLPDGDLGRIGLVAAPSEPSVVYAIIEASDEDAGVYRSTDFGENWEKRSAHQTSSGQYYNELFVDPADPDRVYAVDTFTHVSEDGGKTWERLPITHRHVDDHALWIDPERTEHLYIGGDGGIYESWDRGQTWRHVQNLPTAQFYRATPDNGTPFYTVCAGTQDNHTLCGPSRTTYTDGITNADWWISQFGDGFKTQFDPTDPNVVYSQYQYGGLNRFDRVTGEAISITPQPGPGENQYKWNWNAPLIVSPHDPRRLYYGAERLFRSDDRGESWTVVSPDLSRQLDRNTLEVMGRVWSVDAIAKNDSTSLYGSIVALDESPLQEGLVYAGTDDGLIHVTEDGGETWRRVDSIPGVPDQSLIEDIVASQHAPRVAYAVVDNHKRGDFKPYVLRTENAGRSWSLVTGNLPERGTAHTIAEDHVDPNLLFVGTEFGLFFTQEGGRRWHELTNLPTIAVRDLEIQRRESDLVVGTFGLGVWILDDYAPLRTPRAALGAEPRLFPVRDTWLFVPDSRRGWGGLGDYGASKYAAENPLFGALITYHLPEGLETLREQRRKLERDRAERGEDNPYPAWDRLREEDREEPPAVILTIRDAEGRVVRRFQGPVTEGLHRVAWDLRHAAPDPVTLDAPSSRAPWQSPPRGPLAVPGEYSVTLERRVAGQTSGDAPSTRFTVKPLTTGGLVAPDPVTVLAFQERTADLYRAVEGADRAVDEIGERLEHLLAAADLAPQATREQAQAIRALRARLADLRVRLNGDRTVASRNEPTPLSVRARVSYIVNGHWDSRAAVPAAYRRSLEVADDQFTEILAGLKVIAADLAEVEQDMESVGAPWTPGRLPDWP